MKLGHLREPQIALLYSFVILLVLDSYFNNFAIFGRDKGQLISECLFGVLNFPKHQQKI